MKIFEIYIDGLAYEGESEETEPANYGGSGWHVHNHQELNKLIFGDTPHQIWGTRGLNSALDRIVRRMNLGMIKADEIIIKVREE